MIVVYVVIFLLVILCVSQAIIIRNFILKEKKWVQAFDVQRNYMLLLSDEIKHAQQHLQNLDEKGVFQSDDEVGFFFDQMKRVQVELNKYIIPETYGQAEENSK